MSSQPFSIDQLFGGFCPPAAQNMEGSDDESSYGKINTRGTVSEMSNPSEANSSPTITTSTVDSTSNESMDLVGKKVAKSPRRRILPDPILTAAPTVKKAIPQLADTPSSDAESEGAPTPSSEKEMSPTTTVDGASKDKTNKDVRQEATNIDASSVCDVLAEKSKGARTASLGKVMPSTEIENSSKATKIHVSRDPTNRDASKASDVVAEISATVKEDTLDKEEEIDRSSPNTMLFHLIIMAGAFFLYFLSNFNRADLQTISLDSFLDFGTININSKSKSMATEDPIKPVSELEGESESILVPPMEQAATQDEIDHDKVDESILEEPESDEAESLNAESPPSDTENDEDSVSAGSADEMSMSMSSKEQVDASVDHGVEGVDLNSDLEDEEQGDINVEREVQLEDSTSYSVDEDQTDASAERSFESEELNSNHNFVHDEQVDTRIENYAGIEDIHSNPDYGEQMDTSTNHDSSEEQYTYSELKSGEQAETSMGHEIGTIDTDQANQQQTETNVVHDAEVNDADSVLEYAGSDPTSEEQAEISVDTNAANQQQTETNVVHDDEVNNADSDPTSEEQAEISVDTNAANQQQTETSAVHDAEVNNAYSDPTSEEQAEISMDTNAANQQQTETSVVHDDEVNNADSDPTSEEQAEISVDTNAANQQQTETSAVHDAEVNNAYSDPTSEEQAEISVDTNAANQQQTETSVVHDPEVNDADSDLEYEEQIDNMAEHDRFLHQDYGEQADSTMETDAEIVVSDSNHEHEGQNPDTEHSEQLQISVQHDVEVDDEGSYLGHEEQVHRTLERDFVFGEDTIMSPKSDIVLDVHVLVEHEDPEIQDSDSHPEVQSTVLEVHENDSIEIGLSEQLEYEETDGVEEGDSDSQGEEEKKLLNGDLAHSTVTVLIPETKDKGLEMHGEVTEGAEVNDSLIKDELLESAGENMKDCQDCDESESESTVTTTDEATTIQNSEPNQGDDGEITLETGSTRNESEPAESNVNVVVPEVRSSTNSKMFFFKLRSDEVGPYLVKCEAYLDRETVNTSPQFVCSE